MTLEFATVFRLNNVDNNNQIKAIFELEGILDSALAR